MVDTLRYTKKLESAGISREHAEAHVVVLAEMIEGDLATKADILRLEGSAERRGLASDDRFAQVDRCFAQVDRKFDQIDLRLAQIEARFEQLETRLVLKLGGLFVAVSTIAVSLLAIILR